jgi:hypothetical protein
MATTDGEASPT